MIDAEAIDSVVEVALSSRSDVIHGMTRIKSALEVIDFTNIKVVTNADNYLLYTSRSPLPYPKGGLSFDYKKFVGLVAFNKNALKTFYDTPKSELERIEECDLIRYAEQRLKLNPIRDEELRDFVGPPPKDMYKMKYNLNGY